MRNHIEITYLIDDDEAVRSALKTLLETVGQKVKCYSNPVEFLKDFSHLCPGCVILDIRMPQLSGLKLQEKLIEVECNWPIIIISGHGDIDACRKAFHNGAIDFLSKPVDEQDLIDAIQKGHAEFEARDIVASTEAEAKTLLNSLTDREKEILDLIVKGFMTKEIARLLSISPRTIESHRSNIASKLNTRSVAEMTRLFIEGTRSKRSP